MDRMRDGRPDRRFFMSLRDIAFWIRNARADRKLARYRQQHDVGQAFELLHRNMPDPYGATFTYYRYQRLKYERMLALLPPRRYTSALDIGCGLGVFTRMLADLADTVCGLEISEEAVRRAAELSRSHANIAYRQADIRELSRTVNQQFDLVVVADVLYYLSPLSEQTLKSIRGMVTEVLAPGGVLLLANHMFVGLDPDSRLTRKIHDCFRWGALLHLERERWHPFFLASVLSKGHGE